MKMPKVSKVKQKEDQVRIINSLKINRTVGLEIEGYMRNNPRRTAIRGGEIKHDGSLNNSYWTQHSRSYGCEVVTPPLKDLQVLDATFADMQGAGWSGRGTRPGMHVHVDVSDFTMEEKIKAAYFGKQVEDIMFLFTRNYRWNNHYCHKLHYNWLEAASKVFSGGQEVLEYIDDDPYRITQYVRSTDRARWFSLDLGKYNWLNIFSTRYPTIEFRLFHTIRSEQDGKRFAYLAHQFIETVKNSTLEHLQFIANSIDQESNVELKAKKFLNALGIPFEMPILNVHAVSEIENKEWKKAEAERQSLSAV
jgi:hypothetical protein